MGQTSNPSLRYPDGTDRPRAVQLRHLAEDTKTAINAVEEVRDAPMTIFTPTITDGSTTLSLGTGGAISGRHAFDGKQHIIDVQILRGTGAWLGSGLWNVGNLPISAREWWSVNGFGYVTGGGKNLPITIFRTASNTVGLLGPGGRLGHTYPAWTSGENIGFRVFYERT